MTKRIRLNHEGFTLIEILIVVIIIGLLAALIAPNLMSRFERAKEEIVKAQIEMLSSSVDAFFLDLSRCPQSLEELIVSVDNRWRGPYLSKQIVPVDPWARKYEFKCPGEHGRFDLYSLGPNGMMDDKIIKNW